jgi:hypothetical protein
MEAIKQQILKMSDERGSPILDIDDVSRTDGKYTYFYGKRYNWRIESVSKTGKTVKGRRCFTFSTINEDFTRISTKKLIDDVLRI